MPPRIRLVAFDMEGCLTDDPTVWEIMHRRLGTWQSHGEPYWRRYCAGEFPYDTFARMDVAVWRAAPRAQMAAAAAAVRLMRGCAALLGALREGGIHVAIISNGLACVAERFRADFGVEHIFANRLAFADGRLTGEIDIRVPYDGKGEVLRALARDLGVGPEETAAVGDSRSDIAMFRAARVSVAFRPLHDDVAAAAAHHVRERDLRPLLPLLLE